MASRVNGAAFSVREIRTQAIVQAGTNHFI